ncbi:MAG: hypothetical protein PSY14_03435 [bacterium]|nr:hypothetical protein [bacterium]
MAEEIKKPKKGLAKWIAGGVLTAVAAGTFVAVAPNFNHKQEVKAAKPIATAVAEGKTEETIPVENGLYPAVTSDQKLVRVYMDLDAIENGEPKTGEIDETLKAAATLSVMKTIMTINSKDIAQQTDTIQSAVTTSLEELVIKLDTEKLGVKAQQGVDFSAPRVTKITDASGNNTIYKAKSANSALKVLGL